MCTPTPRSAANSAAAPASRREQRERGVHTDHAAPAAAQEALVLGQAALRLVGAVAIGDAVRADDAHADLGAGVGDDRQAALDG